MPYPVSLPPEYAFISTEIRSSTCQEHNSDWLNELIPNGFIESIVSEHSEFVVLQFHRTPMERMPWVKYLFDAQLVREKWKFGYETRMLPPENTKWWSQHDIEPIESYGVIAEATTCLPTTEEGELNRAVFSAFERCLSVLQAITDAYAEVLGDLQTGFVNLATALPGVPSLLVDPQRRRTKEIDLRINEEGAYLNEAPRDLTPDKLEAVRAQAFRTQRGDPVTLTSHWRRQAFRAQHVTGDYAAAAIFAQTSGEVFFDGLLQCLFWEDIRSGNKTAISQADVEKWFAKENSLLWRLKHSETYPLRLQQGWYMKKSGNAIHHFETEVTWLRNKVVHGGYRPTGAEVTRSFEVLDAAISYAIEALLRSCNRTKYPFTAVLLCRIHRLEERAVFNGKLEAEIAGAAPGWRDDFYSFRQNVIYNAAAL